MAHPDGAHYRDLDPTALRDALAAEEQRLTFPSFDLDDSWRLGSWLRQAAIDRGHAIGFAVVFGEQRVFHAATEGAAALNDAWLERKFRVVRHFGQSSLRVRATYLAAGGSFEQDGALDTNEYAAAGGAFPLLLQGRLIGAVGVSGLEMHDDHALVVEGLEAIRADAS
ncbi:MULTISPECIES: heme-degrading domain-containing protein [unclassified Curtobacterium]|uniref:heme-degrading domain-containing protein n=1 Tax=unclassified Curtobacterium TaxID=257496 RepID=UPI000F498AC3|nr:MULTISPECIES: heme-binding protein [unclassified Curtobacterium]ROS35138.1 uncharacterized protein (UPF0303 family) [Curtobacterium sp. PhB78]TCU43171.1 uncharacterized protein (UPF0303 family) [Curtobacterium sp. PhB146]TCU81837.1 uncharacterized protein (UPF0303 family) [Curtobacterium sp. PhB191]TDW38503.1 uncharacterized protein (UPF0303 family) [Curtobacterium sp. PhB42]TDW50410.1 uncharacterized protein (UPF0303 family) [Curtobacterium sp. PhB190]